MYPLVTTNWLLDHIQFTQVARCEFWLHMINLLTIYDTFYMQYTVDRKLHACIINGMYFSEPQLSGTRRRPMQAVRWFVGHLSFVLRMRLGDQKVAKWQFNVRPDRAVFMGGKLVLAKLHCWGFIPFFYLTKFSREMNQSFAVPTRTRWLYGQRKCRQTTRITTRRM